MSSEDFKSFKNKLDGIMLAVIAQVIVIAFAAGGAWIQLAQHEDWKKEAQPQIAVLWQWFSSDNRFAILENNSNKNTKQ